MRKLAAMLILVIGIGADGTLYAASASAATPTTASVAAMKIVKHAHHRVQVQPDPFVFAH
jgi:flagellar basal body rod protein FlgF